MVPSYKNFQKALNDITIMNLHIVWIPQKDPFVNQAAPKKFAPKLSYPNESEIENFKPKKILWSSLSLEIRSAPPPPPPPQPWGLERASQHLRICNCLLDVLQSNFKASEKLGEKEGKGRGGFFSPQFPPVLFSCLSFLDYLEAWNRLHN